MPGKQAKVVTPPMLKRMLRRVARSPFPARDRVMMAGTNEIAVYYPQADISRTLRCLL